DKAGNVSTSATVTGINIDQTAPVIQDCAILGDNICATFGTSPYTGTWTNQDVTINFYCSDKLSGLDGSPSAPTTMKGEGANQSVTGTCTDQAGKPASLIVANINIDKTPPTITANRTPAANAAGWNNSNVTVSFT